MNDFEKAKRRARDQHDAWSRAKREKLASDPTAIAKAIRNGDIYSLTKEDRDFLIDAHGGPKPSPVELKAKAFKLRRPTPMESARKHGSARQSWGRGELAHACKIAATRWSVVLFGGLLALSIISIISKMRVLP